MGQVLVSTSIFKPKASTVQSFILRGTALAVVVEVPLFFLSTANCKEDLCSCTLNFCNHHNWKGLTVSTGINGRYTRGK